MCVYVSVGAGGPADCIRFWVLMWCTRMGCISCGHAFDFMAAVLAATRK